MTPWSEVLGQDAARDVLARVLQAHRVPHALLFAGPEGCGKGTTARTYAAGLMCLTRSQPGGCGSCPSCRALAAGSHLDLMWIEREPRESDGQISAFIVIEQIRDLCQRAATTPRIGRRRVVVIDPADRMNLEAQNALLKTLEEPPDHTVVILIASRPHALLPTVRSRCFHVGFAPMAEADLALRLEQRGMSRGEARARALHGSGRPGRALSLDLAAAQQRRQSRLAALESLAHGGVALAELPALAKEFAGADDADWLEAVDETQALLGGAARLACGGSAQGLGDEPRLHAIAHRLGAPRSAELVRCCERLRGYARFNINRTYLAEALLAAVAGAPLP